MKKAVFLDRDGTLIFDEGYISDPEKVVLIPGVADALKRLSGAGFLLVVVSNQSGIGRGYFSEESSKAVNSRMEQLLAEESVRVDGIYCCPHSPEEKCQCRKPRPGLLLKAAAELGIDLSMSAMLGDKESDAEAGLSAGCGCNLRLALQGQAVRSAFPVVRSMPEAAESILDFFS